MRNCGHSWLRIVWRWSRSLFCNGHQPSTLVSGDSAVEYALILSYPDRTHFGDHGQTTRSGILALLALTPYFFGSIQYSRYTIGASLVPSRKLLGAWQIVKDWTMTLETVKRKQRSAMHVASL